MLIVHDNNLVVLVERDAGTIVVSGLLGIPGPAGTTSYAGLTDKPILGTSSALDVPTAGDASTAEVVKGNDSRLSDSRTPTAHSHDDLYFTEAEVTPALAGKAALSATQTFIGAQRGAVVVLTSTAASIAINLAASNNFSHTTTENTTLAMPTDPVAGQSGVITITQGAIPRLFAFNTFWKFPGGTVPSLTAVAGAVDDFVYFVESATRATCQLIKDVK